MKATLKGGGHTVTTSATGKASLASFPQGTRVIVTAAGYATGVVPEALMRRSSAGAGGEQPERLGTVVPWP